MFRNAVKVLVTEAADPALFKHAKAISTDQMMTETPVQGIEHIRYMIVHKLLIMDRWLAEGKAATVKEAIQRYESLGEKGRDRIAALKVAVAAGSGEEEVDDEDLEDVFTILEYAW